MNQTPDNSPPENRDRLVARGRELILAKRPGFAGRWLLVDAWTQHLYLVEDSAVITEWPVSTAASGLDNRQDSEGTPCGLHRIAKKIGEDAEPGMIFKSRQPTGILWRAVPDQATRPPEGDLILTRILTLDGLEDGVNRGPGVDSLERYIYIHGTNHENEIGSPVSGGCVRMTNPDVVALFDQVAEGDPVVIL